MPCDQNVLISRWFTHVWNDTNENAIDNLMHENAYIHGLSTDSEHANGKDLFKAFRHNFKTAYTDIHVNVEDTVIQNEYEVARCTVDAVNAASQQPVHFDGICMVRVDNDKIVEAWNFFDIPQA